MRPQLAIVIALGGLALCMLPLVFGLLYLADMVTKHQAAIALLGVPVGNMLIQNARQML